MKTELEYICQRIGAGWLGGEVGAVMGAVITNQFDLFTFAVLGMYGAFLGMFVGIVGWSISGKYEGVKP